MSETTYKIETTDEEIFREHLNGPRYKSWLADIYHHARQTLKHDGDAAEALETIRLWALEGRQDD